ncbi:MAG: DUF2905 domain-containing protein [Candidatus Omnitrophica bacterium]|nr:DUF2905 domain-containing protein [Candidatus Omnitrophota bacterium]
MYFLGDRNLQEIAKTIILLGIILIAIGIILFFGKNIPFIGKLPGDICIQKKNFTFYFPVVTSILASVALSLILWFFNRK